MSKGRWINRPYTQSENSRTLQLSVFSVFFVITLAWYLLANQFIPFLITLPVLCWVCKTFTCQVLGEGYTGIGFPGVSLGPSIILGWNASIVSISTTVWIAVGTVLNFWVLAPLLYFSVS